LKVPVLVDEDGPLFGTENICRALAMRSGQRERVVLRGDVTGRLVANAEELLLHAMSNDVTLIMTAAPGDERPPAQGPTLPGPAPAVPQADGHERIRTSSG